MCDALPVFRADGGAGSIVARRTGSGWNSGAAALSPQHAEPSALSPQPSALSLQPSSAAVPHRRGFDSSIRTERHEDDNWNLVSDAECIYIELT